MNGYAYLHFFNLQYWYCVIISLFGGHCTNAQLGIDSNIATSTIGAGTAGGQGAQNFWQWLFGTHPGASSGSSGSSFFDSFAHNPIVAGIANVLGFFWGIFGGVITFLWLLFSGISYLVSFLLLLLLLGSLVGIFLIQMKDSERYGDLPPAIEKRHPLRARWQELLEGAMSSDPKRWKEGILGADVLLGELFVRMGYPGNTTAEQIRAIPEGAFANLSSAWEAHRIKNFVSASSSRFILTQREAFRVMKLYEQVFREFDFI